MSAETVKQLKELREFLTKERWTKHDYAQKGVIGDNGSSKYIRTEVSEANDHCKFCLVGAIFYKIKKNNCTIIKELGKTLFPYKNLDEEVNFSRQDLESWNDLQGTQFENVCELIDNTILRLERADNEGK